MFSPFFNKLEHIKFKTVDILNIFVEKINNLTGLLKKYKKLQEISFTSDRKIMSNLWNIDNENYLIIKGGIDVVLSKCEYYYTNEKHLLTNEKKKEIF